MQKLTWFPKLVIMLCSLVGKQLGSGWQAHNEKAYLHSQSL